MKARKKSAPPDKAFGIPAKKPPSKIPGSMRGAMSKMPAGPFVGMMAKGPAVQKARGARLKGVKI